MRQLHAAEAVLVQEAAAQQRTLEHTQSQRAQARVERAERAAQMARIQVGHTGLGKQQGAGRQRNKDGDGTGRRSWIQGLT